MINRICLAITLVLFSGTRIHTYQEYWNSGAIQNPTECNSDDVTTVTLQSLSPNQQFSITACAIRLTNQILLWSFPPNAANDTMIIQGTLFPDESFDRNADDICTPKTINGNIQYLKAFDQFWFFFTNDNVWEMDACIAEMDFAEFDALYVWKVNANQIQSRYPDYIYNTSAPMAIPCFKVTGQNVLIRIIATPMTLQQGRFKIITFKQRRSDDNRVRMNRNKMKAWIAPFLPLQVNNPRWSPEYTVQVDSGQRIQLSVVFLSPAVIPDQNSQTKECEIDPQGVSIFDKNCPTEDCLLARLCRKHLNWTPVTLVTSSNMAALTAGDCNMLDENDCASIYYTVYEPQQGLGSCPVGEITGVQIQKINEKFYNLAGSAANVWYLENTISKETRVSVINNSMVWEYECAGERVEIYNGKCERSENMITYFCGGMTETYTLTASTFLIIRFISDSVDQERFKLSINAKPYPPKPLVLVVEEAGSPPPILLIGAVAFIGLLIITAVTWRVLKLKSQQAVSPQPLVDISPQIELLGIKSIPSLTIPDRKSTPSSSVSSLEGDQGALTGKLLQPSIKSLVEEPPQLTSEASHPSLKSFDRSVHEKVPSFHSVDEKKSLVSATEEKPHPVEKPPSKMSIKESQTRASVRVSEDQFPAPAPASEEEPLSLVKTPSEQQPVSSPLPAETSPVHSPTPVTEEEPVLVEIPTEPEPEQVPETTEEPETPAPARIQGEETAEVPVEKPTRSSPVPVEGSDLPSPQPEPVEEPHVSEPIPDEILEPEPVPVEQPPAPEPIPDEEVPAPEPVPEEQPPISEPIPDEEVPAPEPGPEKQPSASEPIPDEEVPAPEPGPKKQPSASEPIPDEEVPAPEPVPEEQPPASEPIPDEEMQAPEPVTTEQPSASEPVPQEPAPSEIPMEQPPDSALVSAEQPLVAEPVNIEEPSPVASTTEQPHTVEELRKSDMELDELSQASSTMPIAEGLKEEAQSQKRRESGLKVKDTGQDRRKSSIKGKDVGQVKGKKGKKGKKK